MRVESMNSCGMYSSSMDSDQVYLHENDDDDLQDHPDDPSGTSSNKAEIRKVIILPDREILFHQYLFCLLTELSL